jgi:hypothetical protein
MTHEQQPPRDEATEREWALQEQALRAERLGLDPRGDATLQRYRAVMHALRQPLDDSLPADFAVQVAAQVRRTGTADMRFELWLTACLLGLLIAMLIGLAIRFGGTWLLRVPSILATFGLWSPWLLTLVVCIGLQGVLGRLGPRPRLRSH